MTEVLTRDPDTIETEIQFEQFDQVETEELLFPKLDGVLLPIVMDNADVVAPCWWMGGDEVSLTVALNNYYQQMTEENADEVIADVCEFLTSRPEPEEKNKQELDPTILIIEHEESRENDEKQRVDALPINTVVPTYAEIKIEPPATDVERSVETTQQVAAHASAAHAVSSFVEQPDVATATEPEPPVPLPRSPEERNEVALEIRPSPTETVIAPVVISSPAEQPPILEVEDIHDIEYAATVPIAESSEDTKETMSDDEHTSALVSKSTETTQDVPPVEIPADEVVTTNAGISEPADIETRDEPVEPERVDVNNDRVAPDTSPATEDTPFIEINEVTHPSDDIDMAVQKIDALLTCLGQIDEDQEVEEANELGVVQKLADIISEISQDFVSDEDEAEYADTDEEYLLELYSMLLERTPSAHKPELAALLVTHTFERQSPKEEATPSPAIRKRVKALAVVVKRLKRAWDHVVAIGKLALRSNSFKHIPSNA